MSVGLGFGPPVETDGRVLSGVAVPYGQTAVVSGSNGSGGRIVHAELWDESSIIKPGAGLPLLMSHNDAVPIGQLRKSRAIPGRGLEIEAELVGSDIELEGIRRKVESGLVAALSVGFVPDPGADVWTAPARRGELPLVLRRNAKLREISLVVWPAFNQAVIQSIRVRTKAQQHRHEESERAIAEARRQSEEVIAWLDARKAARSMKGSS